MAMTTVNIHEAKTNLSKLIQMVEAGEEVIIARAGKPAVRLSAFVAPEKPKRKAGFLKDYGFKMPKDIKKPFEKDIEEMFYGNPKKFSK
ncbi:type II toxin-antitoxin system Phd/YefM family antitoxin [Granulicella cerasi]|uniref:Antitoxin n=1 Tax=Granulicella cerasi TaxID=741063 RepID=A0ABW1ZA55_9BACT|nr:type II toxin-antitoxin system Phd/YefM family antitoxin [Granulicella cerasi]